MSGPLALYTARLDAGELRPDAAQRAGVVALQATFDRLYAPARRRWWSLGRRTLAAAPSVYLHGPVGRGKSLIMDLFVEAANQLDEPETSTTPNPIHRGAERVHFHAFMLSVHQRIHELQQNGERGDPMPTLAREIAGRTALLCFDEFVVNNIADAMILGRLFTALWAEGLTLIATSNFAPERLYEDGLHRSRFLPFIDYLVEKMEVIEVAGDKDYRRLQGAPAAVFFPKLTPATRAEFENAYRHFTGDGIGKPGAILVGKRKVALPWVCGRVAMATFADLCERPLGAADYLALTKAHDVLAVDQVPRLGPDQRNEASRFKVLIDTLYEAGTLLVLRTETALDSLSIGPVSTEFSRTLSRLNEMQSQTYVAKAINAHQAP